MKHPKPYSRKKQQKDLNAAASGSETAFNRFYERTMGALFSHFAFVTGSQAEAEEIVSETYLRLVRALPAMNLNADSAPRAWLFTVANNILMDRYRKEKPGQSTSLDEIILAAPDYDGPEYQTDRSTDASRLRKAMKQLSPRQQQILSLRYFGDMRNREIATQLKIDERTVSAHLARGLKLLRQIYLLEEVQDERVEEYSSGI